MVYLFIYLLIWNLGKTNINKALYGSSKPLIRRRVDWQKEASPLTHAFSHRSLVLIIHPNRRNAMENSGCEHFLLSASFILPDNEFFSLPNNTICTPALFILFFIFVVYERVFISNRFLSLFLSIFQIPWTPSLIWDRKNFDLIDYKHDKTYTLTRTQT